MPCSWATEPVAPTIIPLIVPGITYLGENKGSIKSEVISIQDISSFNASPNEAFLDYSKSGSLYVKYRRDGDSFTPFGMKGKKNSRIISSTRKFLNTRGIISRSLYQMMALSGLSDSR